METATTTAKPGASGPGEDEQPVTGRATDARPDFDAAEPGRGQAFAVTSEALSLTWSPGYR